MRILLIEATSPATVWPRGLFRERELPAALASQGGLLRAAGHDVRINVRRAALDRTKYDFDAADAQLLELVDDHRPELIAVSAETCAAEEAWRLAQLLRERVADSASILLSGAHATALGEQALGECNAFDAVVLGEADGVLSDIADRGLGTDVAGLVIRNGQEVVRTPDRPPIRDLDSLGMPAWDLFDTDWHTASGRWMIRWLKYRAFNIRTSRGCPGRCTFCAASATAGPTVRLHSAEHVLEQVRLAIERYGVQAILFEDETIGSDRARLMDICQGFLHNGWDKTIDWAALMRVDQVDAELLAMMKRAGCIQVEYGFESGSDRSLKAIGKGTTVEQNVAAADYARRAGLRIFADWIFGLPGETADDLASSVRLLRRTRAEVVSVALLSPLPGTALYRSLPEETRRTLRWSDFAYLDQPGFRLNFTAMPDEEFFNRHRRLSKYLLKPLIAAQILRDAGNDPAPSLSHLRRAAQRFKRRHPLRAWRLPV